MIYDLVVLLHDLKEEVVHGLKEEVVHGLKELPFWLCFFSFILQMMQRHLQEDRAYFSLQNCHQILQMMIVLVYTYYIKVLV